jgi:hypothetical protein
MITRCANTTEDLRLQSLAWPPTDTADVLSQTLKALAWVRIGEEQAALF